MKAEDEKIKFEDLVRVRRDEMASILPGFYTQVVNGDKVVVIESPSVAERSGT